MADKLKLKKIVRKGKFGEELYVGSNQEPGYTSYFRDFPNIVTQGETIKEAQTRLWHVVYDVLKHFLNKPKKSDDDQKEALKTFATKFFYWWYNKQGGTNTQEGFDTWWEKEGKKIAEENGLI